MGPVRYEAGDPPVVDPPEQWPAPSASGPPGTDRPLATGNARVATPHSLTHQPADPTCWVCSRAKLTAHRTTPAAQSTQWETEPMLRGHGDLIGPTDAAIVGGEHYLFVTYDEGSKYIKLGGLVSKTPRDTSDMYLKLWGAERQPFPRFRTDNGGEF